MGGTGGGSKSLKLGLAGFRKLKLANVEVECRRSGRPSEMFLQTRACMGNKRLHLGAVNGWVCEPVCTTPAVRHCTATASLYDRAGLALFTQARLRQESAVLLQGFGRCDRDNRRISHRSAKLGAIPDHLENVEVMVRPIGLHGDQADIPKPECVGARRQTEHRIQDSLERADGQGWIAVKPRVEGLSLPPDIEFRIELSTRR